MPSIDIHYWFGERTFDGVDDFRKELSLAYPDVDVAVKGEQGELGGGLYTLYVELVAALTLKHFLQLILDGVAFDLIKLGADRFMLRPLIEAQRKLRARNTYYTTGEIARLVLVFNETVVTIDADSRVEQSIAASVRELLTLLAAHYSRLVLTSGEPPASVYIPVIEDTTADRVARFRAVLEVDEAMPISKTVFYEYWGVTYGNGAVRVYDVVRCLLLDEQFVDRQECWRLMATRWRQPS